MSFAISSGDENLFLKLMITQLQNQNPMEPMSNSEMMTQMAQFTTVEAMNGMRASFGDMLQIQRLTGGADIIGRDVEYLRYGEYLRGVVDSMGVTGGEVRFRIDGEDIPLKDLTRVF